MGFRSTSTRRTSAASAVSSQSVVVNTSTGLAAVGSAITSTTAISLGITTVGQTSAASFTTVSAGPVIGNIQYLDANNQPYNDDIAVSTLGGNILINGSGFAANSSVYVNNTLVSNTFISSTQIRAILPSASPGNVALMIFTPTNVGTISTTPIRYSGFPTWTTSAVSLQNNSVANVALVASGDSTITYTLQAGSSLPTGISLDSTGYLTGTATGYLSTTSTTAVIIATDLEGQAAQQTINFTITSADSYFPYTTLLLNGDTGTNVVNAATNNVFVDSSSNNFTITRLGTATQGSFSPFSQTGWSNYFNGTTDYFTVPAASTAFGANPWTAECWVFVTSLSTALIPFDTRSTTSPNNGVQCTIGTNGSVVWFEGSGTTVATAAASSITVNTWYHIAFVRSGTGAGQCAIYVNGVSKATGTSSLNHAGNTTWIGRNAAAAQNYFPGYISNLRVVNGTAVYTSSFTPPVTPLTAVANTSLLICQSNRFKDSSSNAYTITVAGTPSVQAFSPFSPSGAYSDSTNGGAAYLDGSGNYLSVATNAAFNITSGSTDSFICEGWVYWTTVAANMSIIENGSLNNVSFANWAVTLNASSQIAINWGNSAAPGSTIGILPTSIVPVTGQWYHIAFVKTNADWALFVNGTRATNYSGLNTAAKTSATALYIGYGIATSAAGTAFKGYISNVRIYKGATASAPYAATSTTITVPTSPVTAITNTSLLANFTNAGIVDAHSSNVLETAGNAQLSTTVKKYGNASMYFDGTGDYVYAPTGDLYAFGTGDFTLEAWIYRTDTGVQRAIIDTRGGSVVGALFYITSNNKLNMFDSSTTWLTSTNTVPANQWVHVAVARASGTTKLFIGGVQEASASDTRVYVNSTGGLLVGRQYGSTSNDFLGYMDDVRITKGFARYTANFTPSTSALLGQ